MWFGGIKDTMDTTGFKTAADIGVTVLQLTPTGIAVRVAVLSMQYSVRMVDIGFFTTEILRLYRNGQLSFANLWNLFKPDLLPGGDLVWPEPPLIAPPVDYISSLPPETLPDVFMQTPDGSFRWVRAPAPVPQPPSKAPTLLWTAPHWTPTLSKTQLVGEYSGQVMGTEITLSINADGSTLTRVTPRGAAVESTVGTWSLVNGKLQLVNADGGIPPVEAYGAAIVIVGQREESDRTTRKKSWIRTYTCLLKSAPAADANREDPVGVYGGVLMGTDVQLIVSRQPDTFVLTSFGMIMGQVISYRKIGTWSTTSDRAIRMQGSTGDSELIRRDDTFVVPIKGGVQKDIVFTRRR